VDLIVKMKNKNICFQFKMDSVVYFAARGDRWWMVMKGQENPWLHWHFQLITPPPPLT
jgi:hypothetical protein